MEIQLWDEEFKQTTQRVDSIGQDFGKFESTYIRTIARKHRVINRCQVAIERIQVRFLRMNQVKESLPKKLSAILYWTAQLANTASLLLNHYEKYLKQFLWIRLFKIRFLGDDCHDNTYLILDSELESIAEKILSQKKMEAFLHRQHYNLRLEERTLRQQYNHLQTEDANFEASQCLQMQWGHGAVNSQRHPTLGEMQRLLYGISFKINPRLREATQLKMLSKDFYLKTQLLMDECRSLMEQNDRTKSPYFNRKKVEKVQDSLKQIRNLELQVDNVANKALPNIKQTLPILLKKKVIQVKTMPDR